MQNDLSKGGDDRLDDLESQEVDASSGKYLYSFYLAMWNADMKLEKQGL